MRYAQYWNFQGASHARDDRVSAKVAQQEIQELTNLAAGLLEFEKIYTSTHGERTPVFRLLSMVNEKIAENQSVICSYLLAAPDTHSDPDDCRQPDSIPF